MTKIRIISFFLLLGLIFNACSKDEKTSSLTCKVDGVVFTAATLEGSSTNAFPGIKLFAKGANTSDPSITLQLFSEELGTSEPGFGTLYNDGQTAYFGEGGEVEITISTEDELSGTFSFYAPNPFIQKTVEITEGEFTL